jgi:hypothetical protein
MDPPDVADAEIREILHGVSLREFRSEVAQRKVTWCAIARMQGGHP